MEKRKQKKLSEEEYIQILNVVIDCITLQQNLLPLMNTNLYNAAIVRNARLLSQSLKHICNNAGKDLFEVQPEEMDSIVEMKAQFLQDLNKVRPEEWQIAAYVLKWINQPDSYCYRAVKALCVESDVQDLRDKQKTA